MKFRAVRRLFGANRRGLVKGPATVTGTKHLLDDGTFAEVTTTGIAASQSETNTGTEAAKYVAPLTLHGYVNPLLSTRATAPFLLFDGATTSRRAEMTPGTAGAVAGMPISIPFEFDVPTSNPSAAMFFIAFAPTGTNVAVANALIGYLGTDGSLRVKQFGTLSTYYRELTWSSFRSAYSGIRVRGILVFEGGDTTTAPKIYIQGSDVSSNFSLGTVTPPNWMPLTLDTTKFVSGLSMFAGRLIPHAPILGALTAAEVLAWTQTGLLPNWCYAGTGSAVAFYTTDFSSASGWSLGSGPNWSIGSGVATLLTPGDLGSGTALRRDISAVIGKKYRVTFTVAGTDGYVRMGIGGANGTPRTVAGTYTEDVVATGSIIYFFTHAASGSFAGTTIDDLTVTTLGPIARHTLQPGAVVHPDDGANKLPLLLTAGVTAVGSTPNEVVIPGTAMTADGFVHADQVITPTGYELVAAYAEQTGTETSTITVKETSSGGTTVATGALSASVTRVALTVSNGLLAGGKKLHLANSSWAGNTVTPFFVFRRAS